MTKIYEEADHIEALLTRQHGPDKRVLVARIKQALQENFRPYCEHGASLSDDDIVELSIAHRDAKGRTLSKIEDAYVMALRWCIALQESHDWNEQHERRLITALRAIDEALRIEGLMPLVLRGKKSHEVSVAGGAAVGKAKKQKAEEWQARIRDDVLNRMASGWTLRRIGRWFATDAGVGEDAVRKFASELKRKK